MLEQSAPAGFIKSDERFLVGIHWGVIEIFEAVKDGETYVPGKRVFNSNAESNDFKVVNPYDPKTIEITAEKSWAINTTPEFVLPVTVELLQNNAPMNPAKTVELNSDNGWTKSFGSFPRYDTVTGAELIYTVVETHINDVPVADFAGDVTTTYTRVDVEGTPAGESVQRLVRQDFTASNVQEFTSYTVSKTWVKPSSVATVPVTISLYANGAQLLDSNSLPVTVVLSDANGWTHTFTGLRKSDEQGQTITYTAVETPVDGFTPSNVGGAFTNTIIDPGTQLTATKSWSPATLKDKYKDTVTLAVYADGEPLLDGSGDAVTISLSDSNGWTYTISGLDKYKFGDTVTEIVYTVQELGVSDGKITTHDGTADAREFTVTYSGNTGTNGAFAYNVTNTLRNDTLGFSGTKIWNDVDASTRPASITVNLLTNGAVSDTRTINAPAVEGDAWGGYAFTALDKYDIYGDELVYAVTEVAIPGYGTNIAADGTITNTYGAGDTIDVNVAKVWLAPAGTRFPEITVYITDGAGYSASATLNGREATPWTHTFANLPKYSGTGALITYTVTEDDAISGFSWVSTTQPVAGNNYRATITNRIADDYVTLTAHKAWVNAATSIEHEITVDVLGGTTIPTLTLNSTNTWTATTGQLPRYDANGQPISYTIKERGETAQVYTHGALSFNVSYSPDTDDSQDFEYTVTNALDIPTTDVSGTKLWIDGARLDARGDVTIELLKTINGVQALADEKTLLQSDNATTSSWAFTFTDLPTITDAGDAITYSVRERGVVNGKITASGAVYDVSVDGYNITNTLEQDEVAMTVYKQWIGPDTIDARQAVEITIGRRLSTGAEDGVFTSTLTAQYEAGANMWSVTFTGLAKYDSARGAYSYYIKSERVGDSVVTYTDSVKVLHVGDVAYEVEFLDPGGNYTIRNTIVQEPAALYGDKLWGVTGSETPVSIALYADGVPVADAIVNLPRETFGDGNPWSFAFTDLPRYAIDGSDGHEIVYTVKEVGESDGKITLAGSTYTVVYANPEANYVTVTNTKYIAPPTPYTPPKDPPKLPPDIAEPYPPLEEYPDGTYIDDEDPPLSEFPDLDIIDDEGTTIDDEDPPLGQAPPKTGDTGNVAVLGLALAAALTGAVSVVVLGGKKKRAK
jgi:hypothetical protein